MNLFKTIRDRFSAVNKKYKKIFTVQYAIYHDHNLVSRFEVKIAANSKQHAKMILDQYVQVKVVDIR